MFVGTANHSHSREAPDFIVVRIPKPDQYSCACECGMGTRDRATTIFRVLDGDRPSANCSVFGTLIQVTGRVASRQFRQLSGTSDLIEANCTSPFEARMVESHTSIKLYECKYLRKIQIKNG